MSSQIIDLIREHALFRCVSTFIRIQNIMGTTRHIDVALSGGADSVALLAILAALRNDAGWSLRAHHIRHGLRDDDGNDEFIALKVARMLDIKCIKTRLGLGKQTSNTEDIARKARYGALFSALEEPDIPSPRALALAHHGDENVETALWRLGRGCGLEGLSMPPMRIQNGIRIIRPMLMTSKHDIYQFLTDCRIPWAEDPTNASDHYRRNRIRRDILPKIVEESTSAETLYRSLVNIRHDADAMAEFADLIAQKGISPWGDFFCPKEIWDELSDGTQIQIIRHCARILVQGHCPDQKWLTRAIMMLRERKQTHRKIQNGQIEIRWTRLGVEARAIKSPVPKRLPIELGIPAYDANIMNIGRLTLYRIIPETVPHNTPSMLLIDAGTPLENLQILEAAQFPEMTASDGHIAKTREALRSQGIPDLWRPRWPVLCSGNTPLWILGGMRTIHAGNARPGEKAVIALWSPNSVY